MNATATDTMAKIAAEFEESIAVKNRTVDEQLEVLNDIFGVLLRALKDGNKIIFCGNGGSAADSQHIAAEFVSKFRHDRRALAALALTTDTSIMTSVGNDYSFDRVFARQIEALGRAGDVLVGISTSGNSPNVLQAMVMAREMGMATVGFSGEDGGKLKEVADICFHVPSQNTARIQETHITAAHALCGLLEEELCGGQQNGSAGGHVSW